jgi:flagellar biosynthesis/type III secretory pathway protein FliH
MNRKLSLSPPDPSTGFQEWIVLDPVSGETMPPEEPPKEEFGLPAPFWDWLSADSELRRDFDVMIETKAKARLEEKFASLKAEVELKAREEGHLEGMKQANESLHEALQRIEQVCAAVLKDKESLLRAHESDWCRAFSHLLKRFLVPNDERIVRNIEGWLTEGLSQFAESARIKIFLAESDWDHLAPALDSLGKQKWEILKDGALAVGEIRCECEGGGVFFSSQEELQKLESWIGREAP